MNTLKYDTNTTVKTYDIIDAENVEYIWIWPQNAEIQEYMAAFLLYNSE